VREYARFEFFHAPRMAGALVIVALQVAVRRAPQMAFSAHRDSTPRRNASPPTTGAQIAMSPSSGFLSE